MLALANRRAEELEVRAEAAKLGVPLDVDQGEALMDMVREAAGNVAFYRALVQQLRLPTGVDLAAVDEQLDGTDRDDEAQPHGGSLKRVRNVVAEGAPGTLYGRIKPDTFEAKPHVLVVMYDAERDRLATCAALAIRANVDERRVRMAEATTDRLFTAVATALTAAGLTPEQQETFRLALAAALRTTV